jgi:hypothetical protein
MGIAASIVFVGNSFTFGELSPVEHYQPESVHDLNHEGIGGVPALFKAFTAGRRDTGRRSPRQRELSEIEGRIGRRSAGATRPTTDD